ncbi:hypothetical protein [Enterococcus sp. AZ103]|uniref:hypothetical protein n=1 Tax=Enterococcus sp. AZ103 TaxID=2774628 RepID=UPI003F27B18B
MNVKVNSISVFYNGVRYQKDDELTIEKKHFNEKLFTEIKVNKKKNASKEG